MKIPITQHTVMPEVYAYSIQQVMMKLAWHVKCYDPSQTLQREGQVSWSTRCVRRRADRLGCEELFPHPLHWRENRSQSTTSPQELPQCHHSPRLPFYGASDDPTGGTTIGDLCPEQEHAPTTHTTALSLTIKGSYVTNTTHDTRLTFT